eukprot:jgi/Botrbrau1/13529/Bobra.0347s0013.1
MSGLLALPLVLLGRTTSVYGWFIVSACIAHVWKLYYAVGIPKVLPWGSNSWAALTGWWARVAREPAFMSLVASSLFLNVTPFLTVIVSTLVPALFSVGTFLATSQLATNAIWAQYGEPAFFWLRTNREHAFKLAAFSEIWTGVLLLIGLLTPRRNMMLAFMYWRTVLPARYWSSDAGMYHRQVWDLLATKTANIRQQFPLLQQVVGFVGKAFQRPM